MAPNRIRKALLSRLGWITARAEAKEGTEGSRAAQLEEFGATKALLEQVGLWDEVSYLHYADKARGKLRERGRSL